MAFDGTVIANLVYELNQNILNSRISKIAQPEKDELLFTLKGQNGQQRLAMSASASLPFLYLTKQNKPSPMTAPNFCMLLRKHIANGKIVKIHQPGLERIIHFEIEHFDDLGDLCRKTLTIELMGKHSNIIFCTEDGAIIDSIKHISAQVSSIREVLPGRTYFIPETTHKENPLQTSESFFLDTVLRRPESICKAIYNSYTGISPVIASEICFRSGIDADLSTSALNADEKLHLYHNFDWFLTDLKEAAFTPNILYRKKEPIEFSSFLLTEYNDCEQVTFDSVSEALETYYAARNVYTRIRQKSSDLRRIVHTALERNRKKYTLQQKQLKDTDKREKYRIYGELLNTYGYQAQEGAKKIEALNYYTNEMITIPLDEQLSPLENAQKYFERYNKLKRTHEALTTLIEETKNEIEHLESIATALDIALLEDDLVQIREELMEFGYIRKKRGDKKAKIKSRPLHFVSSDGFHMYVGKNNYQNDELTFKFATGNDWWFHAKGMPGSHVIVKTESGELPDRTFEEAGKLAGFYSKGRENEKVEIDYLQKKNVKKPNKSAPGFVVYYTNYSLTIHPDISEIEQLS
ncbi:MAG: fibronectin/fibrinogen-binding protein [Eubacterium sp.]|jgi:predicted ribosome quality control (RQC) complex YloA/Tae2 family protein|nr:fibronectin/fibrinogen-binding protein [Eubacterium sp.]